jgi:hypothetical protein
LQTTSLLLLQFVTDLNGKYAPVLAASQDNATFKVGELVVNTKGSAVHMFEVNFDRTSVDGPGVRFEVSNTTAYCGPRAEAASQALDVALQNGPIVDIVSPQRARTDLDAAGGDMMSSWLIGVLAFAGVPAALFSMSLMFVRLTAGMPPHCAAV